MGFLECAIFWKLFTRLTCKFFPDNCFLSCSIFLFLDFIKLLFFLPVLCIFYVKDDFKIISLLMQINATDEHGQRKYFCWANIQPLIQNISWWNYKICHVSWAIQFSKSTLTILISSQMILKLYLYDDLLSYHIF